MKLTATLTYDAPPDAVFAVIVDRDFQVRVCEATGALSYEVDVTEQAGGATVTTSRELPTDEVPEFVRAFIGATLTVRQIEEWGAASADGSRAGTIVVEIVGSPVKVRGTLSLRPDGAGTAQAVDGEVKASVPLIGGKIEKTVEPVIQSALRVEEREARAWLAR